MKKEDHNTLILEAESPATAAVIWLHGLGADGYDFYGIVPQLKLTEPSSIRFIFPHAPIRPVTLNQGIQMRAWYDVVEISAGAFEDEHGIRDSEKSIIELIEQQEKQGIPSKSILLAGFSQGGVIALQCGLRYPKPLAGIIALSTYLPLAYTLPDEVNSANRNIPIFLAHGTQDNVLPVAWGRNSRQILSQHQYQVEWHEYGMKHTVCTEEIGDISLFLKRVFGQ
jgi:phospholipase/carboxylesterase